jgi:hypothetical protein
MRRPEQQLQIQVANYLTLALRPPTFWTAIDHASGVKNGRLAGALRKARGVRPGLPDILIFEKCDMWTCVIGIELKAAKGKQSAEQWKIEKAFMDCKADYFLCNSLESVVDALQLCGIPLHAKLS